MTEIYFLFLLIIVLAVVLDIIIIRWFGKRNRERVESGEDVSVLGKYSPALSWIKAKRDRFRRTGLRLPEIDWSQTLTRIRSAVTSRPRLGYAVEIVVIIVWAIMITKPYLTFDPLLIPAGGEYLSAIQTHHIWENFQRCGVCALWNGSTRGGSPAFVDPHGSMLHPLVIAATLIWGTLNGSKIALSIAFLLAGLAQWWLARVLEVGWIPRLWGALLAVAGGHLSVRMELGLFSVVLSTASCAFIIPAMVHLAKERSFKAAALLGILLSLAILSGQGYMQVGLLFILPASLFLVFPNRDKAKLFGKRIGLAFIVAFLLAAPFIIPFAHFLPNFGKFLDPAFAAAQSFEYIPLNLVIRNPDFFRTDSLEKAAYPVLNGNYIGWTAVILAVISLFSPRNSWERRYVNFLFSAAVLAMWLASALPLRWMVDHLPFDKLVEIVSGVRNTGLIAGLALPPILGLAALGLDRLLQIDWLKLQFSLLTAKEKTYTLSLELRWLLLIPLLFSLSNARGFSKHWIFTSVLHPAIFEVNKALKTNDLQWVNPPFGDHNYIQPAIEMGLKLSTGSRPWDWKDRPYPRPILEANVYGQPDGMTEHTEVSGVKIYKAAPGNEYARVEYPEESGLEESICRAYGVGGELSVRCEAEADGVLIVKENSWNGWRAKVDGEPANLKRGQWLSVSLPYGEHRINFQYRPWDVPLGIFLSVLGLALVIVLWQLDASIERSLKIQAKGNSGVQETPDEEDNPDRHIQDGQVVV